MKAAELTEMIKRGTFFGRISSDEDFDDVAEQREMPGFESEWTRVDGHVRTPETEANEDVTKVREAAYMALYSIVELPDVAGDVSDDFGLMAAALSLGYEDDWLSGMAARYAAGGLAFGEFPRDDRPLEEVLKSALARSQ